MNRISYDNRGTIFSPKRRVWCGRRSTLECGDRLPFHVCFGKPRVLKVFYRLLTYVQRTATEGGNIYLRTELYGFFDNDIVAEIARDAHVATEIARLWSYQPRHITMSERRGRNPSL